MMFSVKNVDLSNLSCIVTETVLKFKFELFYNDKETSDFNLYKSCLLAWMVAQGD